MSTALSIAAWPQAARTLFPGVLACAVVAAAATFLSEHYGAPVMLFALLLGLAMNFLSGDGPCQPGIEFTARTVLRVGVALLGCASRRPGGRAGVPLVIVDRGGADDRRTDAARLMASEPVHLLSGGATAICGASRRWRTRATEPSAEERRRCLPSSACRHCRRWR
jgi:uncharacterized membrane protein YadS